MNRESPCYQITRGTNNNPVPRDNLRLETSPVCFYLVSYHHMDFAKFEAAREGDTLTISFLNRQVRISGRNLRELALGIQDRCVEFIKPMPGRYTAATGSGVGFVQSIEVDLNSKEDSTGASACL